MAKRIITINRMFGSNGRLIGKTLAENLDIGFYDKELIDMAAKKNNIPFDTLAKVDEKKASQWVFPVDSELQFTDNFSFVPMNDVLYDLQRKIILSLPQREDCVIVGRCATNILKDKSLKLFIHAPFEKLDEKICIGQGYRGKTGVLGVGHCTCKFQNYVEGCPPLEGDIYEFLKEYIGERTPGK